MEWRPSVSSSEAPRRRQTSVDEDRRPRTGHIADVAVIAGVRVRPQPISRLPVEAVNALDLGRFRQSIGDVDAPLGDCGSAVAAGYGDAPADGDLSAVEVVDESALSPGSVASGPTPLGPVVCRGGETRGSQGKEDQAAKRPSSRLRFFPAPIFQTPIFPAPTLSMPTEIQLLCRRVCIFIGCPPRSNPSAVKVWP